MKRHIVIALSIICLIGIAAVYKSGSTIDPATQNRSASKTTVQGDLLEIKTITTEQGITVWLSEDHTLPIISLDFRFLEAGSAYDTAEKQGATQLLSNTLDEGAGDLDSTSFQRELQNHSISLSFTSSRDTFGGSLETLTRHSDKAFKLLALAINEPRFDDEPLKRMADANRSRIKSSLANPNWKAARIMNDVAFAGHPYRFNSGGTLSSLSALTADDLREIVQTRFHRKNLVITAAGDITPEELSERVDAIFGKLPAKLPRPDLKHTNIKNGGDIYVYEEDIPQSIIRVKQNGIRRANTDYYAATLMNMILGGGGFGSRLMEEARENRGLTYGIYSNLTELEYAEMFSVQVSTKNETTQELLTLIQDEIALIAEDGVTEEELSNTKAYMNGSLPLSLTSNSQISGVLLSIRLDDLPITYLDEREKLLNAVTVADVQAVAKKMLKPDNLTTVIVGKPELDIPYQVIETLPNVE